MRELFSIRAMDFHHDLLKIAKAYRNFLKTYASSEDDMATFRHIESVLLQVESGNRKQFPIIEEIPQFKGTLDQLDNITIRKLGGVK